MKNKKIIVISGATSGIGYSSAKLMAESGHHLILACRNMARAENVQKELNRKYPQGRIDIIELNLASLSSIRQFSQEIQKRVSHIDILFNNAGVFSDTKKTTIDGYELTIGVNFLGQVLLTSLLLPLLQTAEKARVINISSEAALFGRLKITDDLFNKKGKGFSAYSRSKLAQVLYTLDLAEQLKETGITVNAVHPGHVATNIWTGDSVLMKIIGPIQMKIAMSADKAAIVGVEAALSNEYKSMSGVFLKAGGILKYNKRCLDVLLRNKLMAETYRELKISR